MQVTILGSGVAGSWIAHNLAVLGCTDFVLFGGATISQYVIDLGPYTAGDTIDLSSTAAETLASHIKRINPAINVEIRGQFDLARDLDRVRGVVVGAMSDRGSCTGGGRALIEAGHKFITLGLPSDKTTPIVFGTDPSVLQEGHFVGPPVVSKLEIMQASVEALKPLFG